MPEALTRRLVLLTVTVAVLALGFAGCGGDDEVGTGATTTTAVESGSGEEDAEANAISIDMKDYSYAVAGDLKAGTSTIALRNSGVEFHMASFGLLQPGKALADVQAALQSEDESAFGSVFAGELGSPGAILSPGQSEEVTTDLLAAGTYAVICFLPVAGGAEPMPHFAKGMLTTFSVAEGDVETTAPQADAEFTIDDGKIEAPEKLKAGENILRVTSAGEGPHEFFVLKKRKDDVTYEDVDKYFTDLFEGDTAPSAGYAETSPAVIVASSFDIATGNTISLTTDLEPGSYLIGCAREPDEDEGAGAKPHTGEIATVTVT